METLGNNPWKPLGTIHGNFHGTLIKLSWNFDQGSMKVLSKFRESFIQGFPWIIPKGFHGFYPGFHGLLSRVSMGFPQGFPRILTWMVPTNSHVETYRGTALSNTWEHMGTTGNLWKPTVGTDHLFVGVAVYVYPSWIRSPISKTALEVTASRSDASSPCHMSETVVL